MGTFDVAHPDVKDFIRAKREDGRLRQFNLSLLITDEFMQAVKNDSDWPLVFPVTQGSRTRSTWRCRAGGLARVADPQGLRHPRRRPGGLQDLQATSARRTCGT
jgi:ribonucleotide reductase alpha subunit